jgi:hypothetical protein
MNDMRFPMKQAIALGLLAVVAGVTFAVVRSGAGNTQAARAAGQTVDTSHGDLHEANLYELDWTASTLGEVSPAGSGREAQLMKVDTALTGQVLVEPLGHRDGLELRAFSLRALSKFSVKVMDQESIPEVALAGKELIGPVAIASFDARGQVQGIAYDETKSPAAKQLLRALVQLFQHTGPAKDEAAWEVVESGAAGSLLVRYQRDGQGFVRVPLEYKTLETAPGALDGRQVLTGETRITLGADAELDTASGSELLSYRRPGQDKPSVSSAVTFTLSRGASTQVRKPDPASLASRVYQPLQDHPADPGLEQRRDQRMAALVSAESISMEIERYSSGAKPDHAFLARTAAYLRVHPEAARALEQRFEAKGTTVKARGFILDLLVGAGDANAQEVLRKTLGSEAAAMSPGDHGIFLQRFSFVSMPDAQSARFLDETMTAKSSSAKAQQGAAVALGSVVQAFAQQGHAALAASYNQELVTRLSEATDKDQQRALLTALGNAAQPDNASTILPYANSAEPTVREQAASALRNTDTPEAHAALIKLSADVQSGVSSLAIRSLSQQALSGEDWATLRDEVEHGQLNAAADAGLVDLVRKQRAQGGAEGDAILRSLLARNSGAENDLGGLIEALLAQR